jgi:site-specific DNA recombinase
MANVYLVKRTSTSHQDFSISAQDAALRKWAEAHGHTVIDESVEIGVSGAKKLTKRSKTMKILNQIKKNDILAVYSLSRLSRSLADLIVHAEILEKKGGNLVSLTEAIDTSSPAGRLFFHMLGALGQFERELVASRVKFGLDHKRSKGEKLGGSLAYGYDLQVVPGVNRKGEAISIKKLIPNTKERDIINTIQDMRAKQYTLKNICDVLNAEGVSTKEGSVWQPSQVYYLLKREAAA